MAGVRISCSGLELMDTSWVKPTYTADTLPMERYGRRAKRRMFQTSSQPVMRDGLLTPGFSQRFHFKVQLPEKLPPSFKGTAVQYVYSLEARALYSQVLLLPSPASQTSQMEPPAINGKSPSTKHHADDSQHSGQQEQVVKLLLDMRSQGEPPEEDDSVSSGPDKNNGASVSCSGSFGNAFAELREVGPANSSKTRRVEKTMQALSRQSSDSPGGAAHSLPPRDRRSSCETLPAAFHSRATSSDRDGGSGNQQRSGNKPLDSAPTTPSSATHASTSRPEAAAVRSFALRMGDAPLVRIAIHMPLEGPLQPGALLSGTLDFRASRQAATPQEGPRCSEVLVLLETEEAVAPQSCTSLRPNHNIIRKVWDEWQQLTPDTVLTHFTFTVPSNGPPSFATPVVSLRWLLRFQFTAGISSSGWGLFGSGGTKVQEITWTLPFSVF